MNDQDKEAFERWWNEEGSGMPPIGDEDHEEHMHRVSIGEYGEVFRHGGRTEQIQ